MNLQRSPSRAVTWMVAAVACFSLMDAGMKQLSASYPTLEVTFLRGAASLPFVLVWVLVSAGPRSLIPRRWGLHLLRGALGMAMIGCFVFALRDLPLSTAYTIYFVAPLLIAALSVPLLGFLPGLGQVGLDVAELQAEHVDAARGQACTQDVVHLLELELGRRSLVDDIAIALELGVHALEVETGGQFAVGLVDGVGQLVGVDFGHDVEGRHGRGSAEFSGGHSIAPARMPALRGVEPCSTAALL